ncbi:MAG: histidine kinase [Comamonadaceae bacterium]|nr:MAG: histidine kinase [Comamonadaceae bacterium]
MAQVVRELVLLLQASRIFPDNITLQCSWPSSSSLVLGSAEMVKQILINLIKNARRNLLDGGLIGVSGGTLVEQANQRYIQFSVRDTGSDPNVGSPNPMFEPVNSDKISTKRSLGLNVVHQLVQKMHGQIRYLISPKGVRYEVLLPAANWFLPSA